MKRRTGKILGIAIGPKGLLIAEVGAKGTGYGVSRVGEVLFPEGVSLETPDKLGEALGRFLKTQQFSTREAVIGLPAKRLITRRKEIPPAAPAVAASMLRLQAEGEFSAEPGGLVMDFAGETSSSEASTVLLVAATRESMDQCARVAEVANLKLRGVTATPIALGRATSEIPGGDGIVLNMTGAGAELIVQHGNSPAQLRHLSIGDGISAESMGALAGEIRRTMAGLHRNGTPLTLAVWNTGGGTGTGNLLEERLKIPVISPDLRTIASPETASADGGYASAVSVAIAALAPDGLPIDFLDSRLAPPPPPSNLRPMQWGIGIGAVVVLLVVAGFFDIHRLNKRLTEDQAQTTRTLTDAQEAQKEFDRLNFVRQFSPHKAEAVACLRDLTALFPDEGTIWATSVTMHPNMSGELAGRALNEQQVLNLLDRLQHSHQFAGTHGSEWHGAAGNTNANPAAAREVAGPGGDDSREGTFVINFVYHGTE